MNKMAESLKIDKGSKNNELNFLPLDFKPGKTDVIIGRGNKCSKHEGNNNLRSIVASRLDEYKMAMTKREKSWVLASVLNQIRTGDPSGKFIKQNAENKRWFDVGNVLAKEKISQTFRDALVGLYRSSNHFKKMRQREMKKGEVSRVCSDGQPDAFSKLVNQSLHVPVTASLPNPLDTISTKISIPTSFSRRAPVYDNHQLEPTPIVDMLKPHERMPSKMQSSKCKPSGKVGIEYPEKLEEIDTSGLACFGKELMFRLDDDDTPNCNDSRK